MTDRPLHIKMDLDGRSSEFVLGPVACLELGRFVPQGSPAYILDEAVDTLHSRWISQIREVCPGEAPPTLILPGGEACKSFARLEQIYQWLAEAALPRDGTIVGIGGGALLDVAGMAAATWRRGVNFVSIPTTVGCFHPASGILADPGFLGTLPRRMWRDGLAEMIKTAAIGDPGLFRELHGSRARLHHLFAEGDPDLPVLGVLGSLDWKSWIGHAAAVKARIVSRDFTEQGQRRSLNLGHTLGHVLEAHSLESASPLSHGQAVAIGMAVVFRIAAERNMCPLPVAVQVIEVLESCGLPVSHRAPDTAVLERLLAGDKKQSGRTGLNWVLPRRIGQMNIFGQVAVEEILRWLD